MAVRRVDLQGPMLTGQARAAAEGRETAHLRCRFSFILQQALSQRTRFHLCRQGVLCLGLHSPLPGPELGEPGGLVELAEPGGSTGREDDDGPPGPRPVVPAEDESQPEAQAPSGDDRLAEPEPRRRSRAEDEDAEAGAPRRKRRRRSNGNMPPTPTGEGEGASERGEPGETGSEGEEYSSLVEIALSVCSHVDLLE